MNRVIKGTGPPARVVPGAVFDARDEAGRIVDEARAEAASIRDKARAEGREAGLAEASALVALARALRARALDAARDDVVELAVDLARRVIGAELALRPEAVADVCAHALRLARRARDVVVRVHPDDLAAVTAARPALLEAAGRSGGVAFQSDPDVGRGGCIVESELGRVDARLEPQLAAIEQALRSAADDEVA